MAESPAEVRRRVKKQSIPAVPVTEGGEPPESGDDPVFSTGDKDLDKPVLTNGVAGDRLRSFVERIERLKEEIRGLQEDVKEVKSEAKGSGFDVKVIAYLIKIRAADKDDLDEFEALVDVYKRALGMKP